MPLRVGILSVAHVHAHGYNAVLCASPNAELVGFWEESPEHRDRFSEATKTKPFDSADALLNEVDAVVIAGTNVAHVPLADIAASKGKSILCEKPLVVNQADAARMLDLAKEVRVMTAFPCRYSPSFARLRERVGAGDIGAIKAICATNRGRCPFDWFVDPSQSGGGAMIDHTVHVADLLRALLNEEPVRVTAKTGSNMYGKEWDDTAMLTIEFGSGVFATLDSSWSRPSSFKTWGDVTMNVVGDAGVIELDMFNQAIDRYSDAKVTHSISGYGSNLDEAMIEDFIHACVKNLPAPISAYDGVQAARVALAGYESAKTGQPVAL